VEHDGFCFPTRRVTVHLTALDAAITTAKEIRPRYAVPAPLRGKPHELLVRGETEIVIEPGRMVPHQCDQLLIHGADAFSRASQGLRLRTRQHQALQAKARLTIKPGIVEYARIVQGMRKIGVRGQSFVYHKGPSPCGKGEDALRRHSRGRGDQNTPDQTIWVINSAIVTYAVASRSPAATFLSCAISLSSRLACQCTAPPRMSHCTTT